MKKKRLKKKRGEKNKEKERKEIDAIGTKYEIHKEK